MKKILLFLGVFSILFMVTGCKTDFDNNDTKLINMSFNKPNGYVDSRYPIGNEGNIEYEMRVYVFNDYTINIYWRGKDTFKKYSRNSELKFTNKTINDKKYKYSETDNSIYYITDYMDDLYIFEFLGNKSEENQKVFMDLIESSKYRE